MIHFQGFETISNTLSMMSLLMAFYPAVQEKLFEELQRVFQSVDEEVTDEKMKELTYMDLVIKETMRFWPPVPFIGRALTQDMEIGTKTVQKSM